MNNSDPLLMTADEIKVFNENLMANNMYVKDPLSLPQTLNKHHLISMIDSISSVPQAARFYNDRRKLTKYDFQRYIDNLNVQSIKDSNPVQFGLIVRRSALRTFPTLDRVFNEGMDLDLDRFQESAVFPGEVVAVLHKSTDEQWYLIRNYNYLAWIQQNAVAIGDKEEIQLFHEAAPFMVVTGDKVFTNYVPMEPNISELQLDMGTRLPFVAESDLPQHLYGQNSYTSYVVLIPVRNEQGNLNISKVLVPRHADVSVGYLPFNKMNIIRQAFKFLGERYGWGYDFNSRDCTGFISDVYKTFGLLLPRNAGQQATSTYGINYRFNQSSSNDDKLAVIEDMEIGDLIFLPGHVVMFLGNELSEPYIIHDVKGIRYFQSHDVFYRAPLNGVSVTPLLPLYLSESTSYLDKISDIKRIRATKPSKDVK